MKAKLISLILICGLALTACTNSSEENTASEESTSGVLEEITETKASDTPKLTETENAHPEFTGIDISEEGLTFSTVNNKSYSVFCCGEGMIYFSDMTKGWKIYSYDGENVKLLSDKRAHYLYYYDKSIYFLSNKKVSVLDDYRSDGILYKYDIESEEVTQLTDEIVHNPRADSTGVYYAKEYEDKFYIYRLDEQSGEEERLYEGDTYYRIGDYVITREVSGKKGKYDTYNYFLMNDNEKICFISDTTIFYDFIHNGVFYYKDWDFILHSVDLTTGEKNTPPIEYNFTILGDEIYLLDLTLGVELCRWQDGNPEKMPLYSLYFGGEDWLYILRTLYTDGESLYALVYPSGQGRVNYMAKIETLDEKVLLDDVYWDMISINVINKGDD